MAHRMSRIMYMDESYIIKQPKYAQLAEKMNDSHLHL